jgi:hypothetical protein
MSNAKRTGYTKKDLRDVSDNPELTKADFSRAQQFSEAFPDLAASAHKGRAVKKSSKNETLRKAVKRKAS